MLLTDRLRINTLLITGRVIGMQAVLGNGAELARLYPLETFSESGVAVLAGALSTAWIATLRCHAADLESRLLADSVLPDGVELADSPGGVWRVNRVEPVLRHSAALREVAADPIVVGAAGAALAENVFLLEDKLTYKPPGSATHIPAHQEWRWTLPLSRRNATVIVPLDACRADNGRLNVVVGSHRSGLLPHQADVIPDALIADHETVPLDLDPGDLAVIGGGIVHFSGPNLTEDRGRRLLLLIFNAASEGNLYDAHRARWTGAYSPAPPWDEAVRGSPAAPGAIPARSASGVTHASK